MKQYKDLLFTILRDGEEKPPARENMPATTSLFGYQNRYDLREGFPILTTKKINFKNIVTELLWFLKGDTNIKYLIDNNCNIWNEDSYNYYKKICKNQNLYPVSFEDFIIIIKEDKGLKNLEFIHKGKIRNYKFGDCGKQYGWLWRSWEGNQYKEFESSLFRKVDQIDELIKGLKSNPEGRRHIITAWNPSTLDDMALNACHSFVQFNCRALTYKERENFVLENCEKFKIDIRNITITKSVLDDLKIPQFYLDCQLYQRSADAFLGVPYNISSYCLLIEILGKIVNMIPRNFIHSFGDVHIYNNHKEQVNEQLTRAYMKLPKLNFSDEFYYSVNYAFSLDKLIKNMKPNDFILKDYKSHPIIKAKLSTGLK